MIDNPTRTTLPTTSKPIGVGKAILLGHLVVTVPMLSIFLLFLCVGFVLAILIWISSDSIRPLWLYGVTTIIPWMIGIFLGWLWWSFALPRWYRWALKKGAPTANLQKRAAATGLVWQNGWTREKTESKPKD